MSKYIVAWASDYDGLQLSTSVYDTLEDAQKVVRKWWAETLDNEGIDDDITEFDLGQYAGAGGAGMVWDLGGAYRDADGYGDEIRIVEV